MFPLRGEIYWVSLDPTKGSEQGKTRPCVVIQNDIGNQFSPTTITSQLSEKEYPHEVVVTAQESGLGKAGVVLLGQIRCVDKSRLSKRISKLPGELMKKINNAIKVSLDLE